MNKKLSILALSLIITVGATAQQLTAKQQIIDCGQVMFMKPSSVEFEVRSKVSSPVTISDVRTSCGCTSVNYPKETIDKGEPFKVKVTYDAKQLGHFEKQVGIYTDGSKEPLVLTVRGIVVSEIVDFSGDYPFTVANIRTDMNTIEFDDVNRGDRPYHKMHIYNNTSRTIEPQVMHLPSYLTAQVSPSRIAPNRSGVITLTLDSRHLRDFGLTQTSVYLGLYPGDKISSEKELSVSAVLLPNFNNINEHTKSFVPKMQISATSLDLGRFDGKAKKKGEIEISNTGRGVLEIRSIQMFESGLEMSLSNKKIAPGSKAKLKIAAVERYLKRSKNKPRILIITNDPSQPKAVVTVNVE